MGRGESDNHAALAIIVHSQILEVPPGSMTLPPVNLLGRVG